MSGRGWIGIDLDGTLATYEGWRGEEHIGAPVLLMLERVKVFLAAGWTVKIFTARVSAGLGDVAGVRRAARCRAIVQDWLERECALPRLEVTNEKDYGMVQLWDDRAMRVEPNTGRLFDQISDGPA